MSGDTAVWKEEDKDRERKTAYAMALLAIPNDPNAAAFAAFPSDPSTAIWAAVHWQHDPFILQYINTHFEERPENARTLGADALANEVLASARTARAVEDKIKLYRLYAEMIKAVGQPGGGTTVGQITNHNVFVLPAKAPPTQVIEAKVVES